MGMSNSEQFKDDDLYEFARIIKKYITPTNTCLELATGRGAVSGYIAQLLPGASFIGIDISDAQLSIAQKKSIKLKNYIARKGDYHNLSEYKDNTFDVVYIVEALCYSTNKKKVFNEVHRVLKNQGYFIIIDGYAQKRKSLDKETLTAMILAEKGMAVDIFEDYSSVQKDLDQTGFQRIKETDISKDILPTLRKFEKQANLFFSHPRLAQYLYKVLPKEFLFNAVSGYLLKDLILTRAACYYITVTQKTNL